MEQIVISNIAVSKVAHINTQQLISEMPEVIAAQNELKKLEDQYAKELETSAKEKNVASRAPNSRIPSGDKGWGTDFLPLNAMGP